jgi:peptidoglycan hydrolase-like protein with peptidoglycan-binding domain
MRRHEVHRAQRRKRGLTIAVGAIALIVLIGWIFASARKEGNPAEVSQPISNPAAATGPTSPTRASSDTPPSPPAPGTNQPSPSPPARDSSAATFGLDLSDIGNVIRMQARLTELGDLKDFSDGRWGARLRTALRAFKASNGLPADEKWDNETAGRLSAANAIRAPHTPAPVR